MSHRIHRLELEVHAAAEGQARQLLDRLSRLHHQTLETLLGRVLDQLSPPGTTHRLETLELDLGEFPLDHLERQWPQRLEEALRRALLAKLPAAQGRASSALRQASNAMDQRPPAPTTLPRPLELLAFYAKTGTLPWWAPRDDPRLIPSTCAAAFRLPSGILSAFWRTLATIPTAKRRLLASVDPSQRRLLRRLLRSTTPTSTLASALAASVEDLHRDASRSFKAPGFSDELKSPPSPTVAASGETVDAKPEAGVGRPLAPEAPGGAVPWPPTPQPRAIPSSPQPTPLPRNTTVPTSPAPAKNSISPPPTGNVVSSDSTTIAGLPRSPLPPDHPDRPAKTLSPPEPRSPVPSPGPNPGVAASGETVDAKPEAGVGRPLTPEATGGPDPWPPTRQPRAIPPSPQPTPLPRNPSAPLALRSVNASAVTPLSKKIPRNNSTPAAEPEPLLPHPPRLGESLTVDGAGLALLWPFLPTLFRRMEWLTPEQRFIGMAERERAIALLGFLVDSDPKPPEWRLSLAKLLCGASLASVCALETGLTTAEQSEANNLLHAVVLHGEGFLGEDIATLRERWLQRPGLLTWRPQAWLLVVEQRDGSEGALEHLPWSTNWIRLPWMAELTQVVW